MAFSGIGQLVQNISDAVEGFVGLLAGKSTNTPYPVPTDKSILAGGGDFSTVRANWHQSVPYAFSVIKNQGTASKVATAAPTSPFSFNLSSLIGGGSTQSSNWQDFVLPINPTELSQDENFAIHIIPTQGGTAVNYSGNRYKDLMISGTTGIAPMRGAAGVDLKTGKPVLASKSDLKQASGFEVFNELRNYFRAYHEFKKDSNNKDYVLVFKNFKDGEFLIIEVPKFSMKRSAASPMLYNYSIQARVLGQVSFAPQDTNWAQNLDGYVEDALNILTDAQGVLLGAQDILRQVSNTYSQVVLEPIRKLGLVLKAFVGVGYVASDVGSSIANQTMSLGDILALDLGLKNQVNNQQNDGNLNPALEPLTKSNAFNSIAPKSTTTPSAYLNSLPGSSITAVPISLFPSKTLSGVQQDQANALALPQSFFKDAKAAIQEFANNAADLFNLGNTQYNSIFERTNTLSPNTNKAITDDEYAVLAALDKSISALSVLLSSNTFYKSTYAERIKEINNSFSDSPNLVAEPSVKEIVLPGGTSLERLALNELGDASRWPEIVEVNSLKFPYISQTEADASDTILVPGDKILIPRPLLNGFPNIPINDQSFLENGLTEIQKNLGIDLKLTPEFDLQLTNSNDVAIVKAEANAAQAIIFKLALEQGDLLDHPNLGVGLIVGTKAQTLSQIQTNIIQTLSQDPRFDHIENLTIQRDGGTLLITFKLWLRNVDTPIPLTIRV